MNTLREAISVLIGKQPTHTTIGEQPTREQAREAWKFIDDYTASRADLQAQVERLREALDDCAKAPFETVDEIRAYARKELEK